MCEEQLEIEHFLQEMQELKNTDITKFTSTLVYNKLLLIGVYANEINVKTKQWFPIWSATFKKLRNINVLYSNRKDNIFKTRNIDTTKITDNEKYLTIYLPLHRSHFNQCTQNVVNFLNKKNIFHELQIDKTINNCCLAIKLKDINSVKLIEKFIKNDQFMNTGLIKPNPFMMNNGIFAISKEGDLSYNMILANFIVNYLKEEENIATLSKFYIYINKIYNKTFKLGFDLTISAYIQNIEYDFDKEDEFFKKIFDYRYITEIILEVLRSNNDFNNNLIPIYNKNNKLDDVTEIRNFYRKQENLYHQTIYNLSTCIEDNIKLLGLHNTMNALKLYQEGNACGFTKKNGIRQNLIDNVDSNILKYILNDLTAEDYVKKEAYNLGLIKEEVKKTDIDEFMDDLIQGLILTYEKHLQKIDKKVAHNKIIEAVELIKNENFSHITNDYQIRKKLMISSKRVDLKYLNQIIYEFLLESTLDIEKEDETMDMFADLIEDLFKEHAYPMVNNY